MSSDEFHKGRLVELEKLRGLLPSQCEKELKEVDNEVYISDSGRYIDSEIIFKYKDKYFELKDHSEQQDDPYHAIMNKNDDGSYSFSTLFYNGGTCLSEMIWDMLEKQDG